MTRRLRNVLTQRSVDRKLCNPGALLATALACRVPPALTVLEIDHVRFPGAAGVRDLRWRSGLRDGRTRGLAGRVPDALDPASDHYHEALAPLDAGRGVVENIGAPQLERATPIARQRESRECDGAVEQLQAELAAGVERCQVRALARGQAVLPEPRDGGTHDDER